MRVLASRPPATRRAVAVLDERRACWRIELCSQMELHRDLRWRGARAGLARSPAPAAAAGARGARCSAGTGATEIDGVAYTAGPGLIGALLTARRSARALALCLGRAGDRHPPPRGSSAGAAAREPAPPLPHAGAAGLRRPHHADRGAAVGEYRVLGQTRDDAAGEAFDKTREAAGAALSGRPAAGAAGRSRARRAASAFRGRCSIGRGSSSVSRA